MNDRRSPLPVLCLLVAVASSIAFLSVNSLPMDARRPTVLGVCIGALASVALSVMAIPKIVPQQKGQRLLAVMGLMLGVVVFGWSLLVYWLSTPF